MRLSCRRGHWMRRRRGAGSSRPRSLRLRTWRGRLAMWRLLRLAIRPNFALRLGQDQRRGLRMGREACQLRRRHRGRRKQQKSKFAHVI